MEYSITGEGVDAVIAPSQDLIRKGQLALDAFQKGETVPECTLAEILYLGKLVHLAIQDTILWFGSTSPDQVVYQKKVASMLLRLGEYADPRFYVPCALIKNHTPER